ncbi:aspartate racemase/maleate isomerase family protein [Sinorhizobium meliloti]|uniref:aspartate racemase/maleate isomerase family protein n=1 Tax=Rhizobium meliloti TaxID=382 RepID=UPI00398A39C1
MVTALEAAGVGVPVVATFCNDAGFVRGASISAGVRQTIGRAEVDTVLVACTQMRPAGVIAELEKEIGKTIITSNQALCWHALRLSGCQHIVPDRGRLFEATL